MSAHMSGCCERTRRARARVCVQDVGRKNYRMVRNFANDTHTLRTLNHDAGENLLLRADGTHEHNVASRISSSGY